MKTVRVKIDPAIPATMAFGRIDTARVDATTQEDIDLQEAADEAESMQDAAKFARKVRRRLGLSQAEFSSASTSHWTPSATGSKANAAPPVRPKPCSRS